MSTEIVVQQQEPTLMGLIDRLLTTNPNTNIETIQKMLEMQERWELNKDKRALRDAMAEFKKNPPAIIKDRIAKVTTKAGGSFEYSFADLDSITRDSQVALAEHGVTHGYTVTEAGSLLTVTCILKYGMYDEPGATLSAGPDNSGTKNDIQAKASTLSYLEKYTFMAAAGLAAGMPDKDGNGGMGRDEAAVRAEVERQKSSTPAAAQVFSPELDFSYNATTGLLLCRIVGVKELKTKGGKDYITLAINQSVGGKQLLSYWHGTHRALLIASVGKTAKFTIKENEKFNQIEDVLGIDGKRVEKEVVTGYSPELHAQSLASELDLDKNDLNELYTRFAHNSWPEVVRMLEERKAAIENHVDVTE